MSTTTTGSPATLQSRQWTNWTHIPAPCGSVLKSECRRAGLTEGSLERMTVWSPGKGDVRPHNHPWSFRSKIISGGFIEIRFAPVIDRFGKSTGEFVREVFARTAGEMYECPHGTIHMVVDVLPGTVTHMFIDPLAAGPQDWQSFVNNVPTSDSIRYCKTIEFVTAPHDDKFRDRFIALNRLPE